MKPLDKSKTKAYTFLLPMLYGHEEARRITNNYKDIDNVYISEDDTLHCVDRSKKSIYSLKFESNDLNEYNLFKQGKYSKFSPLFKSKILKFWMCDDMLKSVLFKGDKIKQHWKNKYNADITTWSEYAEYWPAPNLKKEYL